MAGLLSRYRVIDLADRALLAGRMFAQLGAEVIQIEPPEGSSARRMAPFEGDRSLHWSAFAAGKRSVVLDLETTAGRQVLQNLAAEADFLLDSHEPGWLERHGLGWENLRNLNPSLIHVAITPFGSDGPKAHWQESDLILWAAGGPLFPNRDGDYPPLRISVPQAWLHAAGDAVIGALVAHHARLATGCGQHVDVSVQQSVTQATMSSIVAHAIGHPDFSFGVPAAKPREKATRLKTPDLSGSGARTRRSKWATSDGLVEFHLALGPASGAKTNNFFAWMREEGALPERMYGWDWITIPQRLREGSVTEADLEDARKVTSAFLAKRSKDGIIDEAMRRKLLIAPILTVADLADSAHHRARNFFETVTENGRDLLLPGPFAMGLGDAFVSLSPAPELGEGNADLLSNRQAKPRPSPPANDRCGQPPFEGLKVLDLAWVVAGPAIGRILGDHGATVVRVESSRRVDTARLMGPFPDGQFDTSRSALFESHNANKLGLALDLAREEAREVVRDLVRWADIVIESFAPGQMERWGLDYDKLRQIKPEIIMLSTSLMGQSGPFAAFAGFGNIGAAVSGFQHIVGRPGAMPIGPFGPYTDFVGPRFGTVALLAALDRRCRTGEGAWIDVSQAEAGMQFLAPFIAAYSATGEVVAANGNRDPQMAPHGVFPGVGHDRWVAIAVRDDAEWATLARIIDGSAADPAFATLAGRKVEEDRLDQVISRWTATRTVEEIERILQDAGVPAHVVASSADIVADPQLAHRGHFVHLPDPRGGESLIEATRFTLSDTPQLRTRIAPTQGHDNAEVLEGVIGYDEARIRALDAAGLLV